MTALQRAIIASREREAKATAGEWTWVADGPSARTVIDDRRMERIATRCYNPDADFIAEAKTWEPRFREIAGIAVEHLEMLVREGLYEDQATPLTEAVLARIAAIAEKGLP